MSRRLLGAAAACAAAGLAWGLFEAQWVRFRRLDVPVAGLPPALDGFRILHLSDLHLGTPSLNARSLRKAVEWAAAEEADVVALTGDLLSRQRGEPDLREALRRLSARHGIYAVLGNHDVAVSRDPLNEPTEVGDLEREGAVLLENSARTFEVAGGARVQIVGCPPLARASPPVSLVDSTADLRILLAHFPDAIDRVPPGAFHLVLAGHLHGGQICLPGPRGKIRLLNPRFPYPEGVFAVAGTTLVVSCGLGTTLVPLRVAARPEAALLTLKSPS